MSMQNISSLFLGLQKLAMSFKTADANQDGVLSQDEINIWATNALQSAPVEEADSYDSFRSVKSDGSKNEQGTANFNQLAKEDGTVNNDDINAYGHSLLGSQQTGDFTSLLQSLMGGEPTSITTGSMTPGMFLGFGSWTSENVEQLLTANVSRGKLTQEQADTIKNSGSSPEDMIDAMNRAIDTNDMKNMPEEDKLDNIEIQYRDIFGRVPTAEESAKWLEALNNGTLIEDMRAALQAEPKTPEEEAAVAARNAKTAEKKAASKAISTAIRESGAELSKSKYMNMYNEGTALADVLVQIKADAEAYLANPPQVEQPSESEDMFGGVMVPGTPQSPSDIQKELTPEQQAEADAKAADKRAIKTAIKESSAKLRPNKYMNMYNEGIPLADVLAQIKADAEAYKAANPATPEQPNNNGYYGQPDEPPTQQELDNVSIRDAVISAEAQLDVSVYRDMYYKGASLEEVLAKIEVDTEAYKAANPQTPEEIAADKAGEAQKAAAKPDIRAIKEAIRESGAELSQSKYIHMYNQDTPLADVLAQIKADAEAYKAANPATPEQPTESGDMFGGLGNNNINTNNGNTSNAQGTTIEGEQLPAEYQNYELDYLQGQNVTVPVEPSDPPDPQIDWSTALSGNGHQLFWGLSSEQEVEEALAVKVAKNEISQADADAIIQESRRSAAKALRH